MSSPRVYTSINSFFAQYYSHYTEDGEPAYSDDMDVDEEIFKTLKKKGEMQTLYKLNAKEYIKMSQMIEKQEKAILIYKKKNKSIQADSIESSLYQIRIVFSDLCCWFVDNGFELPDSGKLTMTQYEQYEQLFLKHWKNPNADPDEVKKDLNDKKQWSNPSKYLADAKKKYGISTSELKQHSGFTWIDPKGTAID